MARDRGVAMAQQEWAELLAAATTVTLGTVGPSGRPHLTSMWFAPDGDRIVMWTYGASQKARNVERDPRVTVLAEAGTTYAELRGVCLDCDVEIVRDRPGVLAIGERLLARSGDAAPGAEVLAAQAAKRIGLRLTVVRARSWDHRRLAAR